MHHFYHKQKSIVLIRKESLYMQTLRSLPKAKSPKTTLQKHSILYFYSDLSVNTTY